MYFRYLSPLVTFSSSSNICSARTAYIAKSLCSCTILRNFQTNKNTKANATKPSNRNTPIHHVCSKAKCTWMYTCILPSTKYTINLPNKRRWNGVKVTLRLGWVREPAGANFPLKNMAIFVAFDGSSLPHVAELSNHMHLIWSPEYAYSLVVVRATWDEVWRSC